MEAKKSNDANLEKLRVPLILTGLLFIMSVTLASMSFQNEEIFENDGKNEKRVADITVEKVKIEEKKEEEIPQQEQQIDVPPPPSEETKTKENSKDTVTKVIVPVYTPIKIAPVSQPIKAEIIEFPDVEATFPGGPAKMQEWIAKNVKYPQTSIELGEQGKVYVSFVVEPDGTISNVQVERGISEDLDREAKRLVRNMPAWNPGEAGGKKARTRCRLPINFTIN